MSYRCQRTGREFEPPFPLQFKKRKISVLRFFYVCNKVVSRPFKFISYFGQQRHGLLLARYKEKKWIQTKGNDG